MKLREVFAKRSLKAFLKYVNYISTPGSISGGILAFCTFHGVQIVVKLTSIDAIRSDAEGEIEILWKLRREFYDRTPIFVDIFYDHKWKAPEKLLDMGKTKKSYEQLTPGSKVIIDMIRTRIAMHEFDSSIDKTIHAVVLEYCDQTLDAFITGAHMSPIFVEIFTSMLFIIIHGFAVARAKYPNFTHYDLHTSNVMIKFDPMFKLVYNDPKYGEFGFKKTKWFVPYFGCIPKVIDFGHATMTHKLNPAHENKTMMFHRIEHDIMYLLYNIEQIFSGSRNWKVFGDTHAKISPILDQLDPQGFRKKFSADDVRKKMSMLLTYEQMLNIPAFDQYKTPQERSRIHFAF